MLLRPMIEMLLAKQGTALPREISEDLLSGARVRAYSVITGSVVLHAGSSVPMPCMPGPYSV